MLWFPSSATELSHRVPQVNYCTWICIEQMWIFAIQRVLLTISCVSLFACMPAAFIIWDLLPQGLVLPALSSMKHMQSPAGTWLCRKAFGVQISSHIAQNYQTVLQPSWVEVWPRTAHLSSVGNAGSALNPPARIFGFTAAHYPWG